MLPHSYWLMKHWLIFLKSINLILVVANPTSWSYELHKQLYNIVIQKITEVIVFVLCVSLLLLGNLLIYIERKNKVKKR